MTPEVQHEANSGPTRVGKSYQKWAQLRAMIRRRDRPSVWVLDPADSLSEPLAADALRWGLPDWVFDAVAHFGRTPGVDFIPVSRSTGLEEISEKNVVVEDLVALWVRAKGLLNAEKNANIQDSLTALANLAIYQRRPVRITRLRDAFLPGSGDQQKLLAGCTRDEAVRPFLVWNDLPPREWEFRCGAGQRIIREWLQEPALWVRDGATFDVPAFVNRGGLYLASGAAKEGKVSRKAVSQVLSAILLMLISLARRGMFRRRLVIVIDEGKAAGLLSPHVSRGLAEAAKWGGGVEFHLIFQNLETLEPEVADDVIQNCGVMRFFKQLSPAANRRAAEVLAVPDLNPLAVKRVVERTRVEYAGAEETQVTNTGEWESEEGKKGKSKNVNVVSRPVHRERTDVTEELYALEDLIKLEQRTIARLGVGEARVRRWTGVCDEVTPDQGAPGGWKGRLRVNGEVVPLWKRKLELALETLRQGPYYRTPEAELPPPASTGDAAAKLDAGEL